MYRTVQALNYFLNHHTKVLIKIINTHEAKVLYDELFLEKL